MLNIFFLSLKKQSSALHFGWTEPLWTRSTEQTCVLPVTVQSDFRQNDFFYSPHLQHSSLQNYSFTLLRSKDFGSFSWFLWGSFLSGDFFYTFTFIYILCLSVRLYAINTKTAESIGPKIFEATHMIPRKVYGCSKLQKSVSKMLIWKILKIHENIWLNPGNFFVLQRDRATMKS